MQNFLHTKWKFLPGSEPGIFRVWGERDNHYTTETADSIALPIGLATMFNSTVLLQVLMVALRAPVTEYKTKTVSFNLISQLILNFNL